MSTPERRAYDRERYEKKRDHINANNKAWKSANPEKVKAIATRWHKANAPKIRAYHLRRSYGISLEEYDRLLAEQGGRCAICRTTDPRGFKGPRGAQSFSVDHDHKTKAVRGLLCHTCNVGLGAFRDEPPLLLQAIAYLKEHT